jgi:parvulin-like peptidyl-prolyl isomerase
MVAGLVLVAAATAAAAERVLVEAILIRVNDRIVTLSDFSERMMVELSQDRNPPTTTDAMRRYAERIFDALLEEMILLERAEEMRVTVEDEAVDQYVASIREENELLDDAAFEQALAQMNMTENDLRARFREQILLNRAARSEVSEPEITAEEVRRRYERDLDQFSTPTQVELEQVVFPMATDGSDSAAVEDRVESLVERVRGGADLKAESTLAGVDVLETGAIPVDDLWPELRVVVDGLEEGQISEPIERGSGLLVVRLVRRIPAGHVPFEDVRDDVRQQLMMEAYQEQTQGMVQRLRDEYLVEVHRDRLEQLLATMPGA